MATKLTLQVFILLLLFVSASKTSEEIDWTNSSMWLECDGQYQSPIDIVSNQVEFCPYYMGFSLHAFCMDFMYEEEGQSLTVEAEETGIFLGMTCHYKAEKRTDLRNFFKFKDYLKEILNTSANF